MKLRGRNIEDDDVAAIVAVLDGWSGQLTWELLIEALEARKFARYTRQTLHKHERIARAFAARKKALSGDDPAVDDESPEQKMQRERIARLENEVTRLKAENQLLLAQFVRWAYNAHTRGLDKDLLNRPLPDVNRNQSAVARLRDGNSERDPTTK